MGWEGPEAGRRGGRGGSELGGEFGPPHPPAKRVLEASGDRVFPSYVVLIHIYVRSGGCGGSPGPKHRFPRGSPGTGREGPMGGPEGVCGKGVRGSVRAPRGSRPFAHMHMRVTMRKYAVRKARKALAEGGPEGGNFRHFSDPMPTLRKGTGRTLRAKIVADSCPI
jgi:hypothetical protein